MKNFLKTPNCETSCTGTKYPHCSIYCISPTVFIATDFPPAFGPEIMTIFCEVFNSMSNGTSSLLLFLNFKRSDIQDNYSMDNNKTKYRAEFYKDGKFYGMIVLNFLKD